MVSGLPTISHQEAPSFKDTQKSANPTPWVSTCNATTTFDTSVLQKELWTPGTHDAPMSDFHWQHTKLGTANWASTLANTVGRSQIRRRSLSRPLLSWSWKKGQHLIFSSGMADDALRLGPYMRISGLKNVCTWTQLVTCRRANQKKRATFETIFKIVEPLRRRLAYPRNKLWNNGLPGAPPPPPAPVKAAGSANSPSTCCCSRHIKSIWLQLDMSDMNNTLICN